VDKFNIRTRTAGPFAKVKGLHATTWPNFVHR